MRDEEAAYQWREITGARVGICDQCGRLVEPSQLILLHPAVSGDPAGADAVQVCPACWDANEQGEIEAAPVEESVLE